MDHFHKGNAGLPLLIVALAIAYYFVVFLPQNSRTQQLALNQTMCSQMEQKVLNSYLTQNLSVSHKRENISTQNHFNTEKNKCYVELTELSCGTNANCSNDTSIYDAVENRVVTFAIEDISINNSGLNYYEDDSIISTSTQIAKDTFDSLVNEYMTK